jgi:hypothetical protein
MAATAEPSASPAASAGPLPAADPPVAWMDGLPRIDGTHAPRSPEQVPGFVRFAVTGDLEQVSRTWAGRLKHEGVRVVAEHRGEAWTACSFELADGTRGNVILTGSGAPGEIDGALGRGGHPPEKLAGACVPVPNQRWVVEVASEGVGSNGRRYSGRTTHGVETMFFWDLDGDGQLDALAPVARPGASRRGCPWEVEYEVYLMRGACGHDAGRVGPGNLDVVPTSAPGASPAGLLPLAFTAEWSTTGPQGIPVRSARRTSFAASGMRYQKTSDQTTEGVCHHCAGGVSCRVRP